jgi:hypothetical protein
MEGPAPSALSKAQLEGGRTVTATAPQRSHQAQEFAMLVSATYCHVTLALLPVGPL